MREQILYYAVKYKGEWKAMEKALHKKESWHKIPYAGKYVTIEDSTYPKRFYRLQNPPWILFYEGDISLCDRSSIGVVGSRKCTSYGLAMCEHLVFQCRQQAVIVSGLAKGIDACAHQAALAFHTIGIIGCGLDIAYPKSNHKLYEQMREHHLIMSEYPNGTIPFAYHFPWRNRLIAAASDALVVVEAAKRSGSMLTVNEALCLDIPVYCFPHVFGTACGEGCNLLISQGANILMDDQDIRNIFINDLTN